MQNRESYKSLRENYKVPKGEEKVVHYLVEKPMYDPRTSVKISKPNVVKTDIQMFDMVKRDLELRGYMVFILYHPQGKYNEAPCVNDPLAEKEQELDEAMRENMELKAKLAALEAEKRERENEFASSESGENDENEPEKAEANEEKPATKREYKPRKANK